MINNGPIGIFDSGYGGLTVLKSIQEQCPYYDFVYLGDNARAPYGNLSFDVVYNYTLQAVKKMFDMGCPLVILACNTASAKALRNIQQTDLIKLSNKGRVLGVLRPTTEEIGSYTQTNHIGILGTKGTVQSNSYPIEINNFFPEITVVQQSCPMWVPLIEDNSFDSQEGEYFVEKYITELLDKDAHIDTIVLACTHYPIIKNKIKKFIPSTINIFSQGDLVAQKLLDYLKRHPEIDRRVTKNENLSIFTTGNSNDFDEKANLFFNKKIKSKTIVIN